MQILHRLVALVVAMMCSDPRSGAKGCRHFRLNPVRGRKVGLVFLYEGLRSWRLGIHKQKLCGKRLEAEGSRTKWSRRKREGRCKVELEMLKIM